MQNNTRALHFVFKIGNRNSALEFFKNLLGMTVLRHEEFEEGCKATCNGPYDGKWSKTMIGYGDESTHFVCELTYNYGIGHYQLGNDFRGLYIQSSEAIKRAETLGVDIIKHEDGYATVTSPDGYPFHLIDTPQPKDKDPVTCVELSSSNLNTSINYWRDLIGMKLLSKEEKVATFSFDANKTILKLVDIGCAVNHAKAFGRIAFACPASNLKEIESRMNAQNQTILTPYVSLDTPGKASVQVVILADPDGHEICFVGDEGFRELSQMDDKATELLNTAILNDKSNEWFAKKGGKAKA